MRNRTFPVDRSKSEAHATQDAGSHWAIVLAGGNGSRMSRPIRQWLGEDRPKQFCAFVGSRTMLQHTIDRVADVVPAKRIVVVIRSGQRRFFAEAVHSGFAGRVIEQPSDRGTMPTILSAVAHVLVQDPNATVLLSPSDHFVGSEKRYAKLMAHGLRLADRCSEQSFLLGVKPDRAETDYGWIVPGEKTGLWDRQSPGPVPLAVRRFREKPSPLEAEQLLQAGGLWNSSSIAARARTLWRLGWRILPQVMPRFETLLQMLSAIEFGHLEYRHETMALDRLYRTLDVIDFSKDILEKTHEWCAVLPVDRLDWSDWGSPERIRETMLRLGRSPAIPIECLEAQNPPAANSATATARVACVDLRQHPSGPTDRWHRSCVE